MLWREAPENFGYFRCSRCSKTTKMEILWLCEEFEKLATFFSVKWEFVKMGI